MPYLHLHLNNVYEDMGVPIDETTKIPCSKSGVPYAIMHTARRSGNTTRMVDHYIQVLFKEHKVTVKDHSGFDKEDDRVTNIIIQRLQNEHRMNNKDFMVGKLEGFNTIIIIDPSKLYR